MCFVFLVANYLRAQIGALISCLRIRSQPFLNVAFSTLSLLESKTISHFKVVTDLAADSRNLLACGI